MLTLYDLFISVYHPSTIGLTIGFILAFAIIFIMEEYVIHPIKIMNEYLTKLQHEPTEIPVLNIHDYDELIGLVDTYANRLTMECDDSKVETSKLWKLAHTDSLTSCGNRLMLDHDITHLIDSIGSNRIDICFAMIDGNGFKYINDTYGHAAGDQALQHIADTIKSVVRTGDKVYRLGGDEFAVLFVHTTLYDAIRVMNRCSFEIAQNKIPELNDIISVSIGVSHIKGPFKNTDIITLKKDADEQLYAAKSLEIIKVNEHTAAIPVKLGGIKHNGGRS